ncbi:MAG: D-TA family PLP-dependent enzyme, partial [Rhodothermales bacterium]|nr:D-TA family PLP-dependent enzyme [Rhodothermales bacterium]
VTPRGVMFYPGHIRIERDAQSRLLGDLDDKLTHILEALSSASLTADVVSGGSTPTLWSSHLLGGLTEVRAGTCIFNDRDIRAMQVCTQQQLAYSVLATVVSTAVPGQVVVDAGSKALAKESFRSDGGGFGVVFDRPEVFVRALSEEHGVLDLTNTDWRPGVGDRIRIVPNHVCVSVNLQDGLLAIDGGRSRMLHLDGRGRAPYPGPA